MKSYEILLKQWYMTFLSFGGLLYIEVLHSIPLMPCMWVNYTTAHDVSVLMIGFRKKAPYRDPGRIMTHLKSTNDFRLISWYSLAMLSQISDKLNETFPASTLKQWHYKCSKVYSGRADLVVHPSWYVRTTILRSRVGRFSQYGCGFLWKYPKKSFGL